MFLSLTAVYKQNLDETWDAIIKDYPFILVENAEDIDSARLFLELYAAEEFGNMKDRIDYGIEDEEFI